MCDCSNNRRIVIRKKERIMMVTGNDRLWVDSVIEKITNKMEVVSERSKDKIPAKAVDGVHDDRSLETLDWNDDDGINWWTNGFWGGMLWLMYHETKEEKYADIARISEKKLDRCFEYYYGLHHDVGFMWLPTAVADYRLTKNPEARRRALHAANLLAGRFNPVGRFIRAWNNVGEDDTRGWAIIDCLLNLPLLYWATEETKDEKYREIAEKHIHTAIKNVIREDYSTWHTFYFNMETGEPDHGATCQGYRDGSAWARGQAWGIYGSALAYRYTKREEYVDVFKNVTQYYLEHLPKDMVPYWDLEFGEGSTEPRDSSSASIAACGLLEMSKYLNEEDAAYYTVLAKQMMKSVVDHYAVKDSKESNGLVLHSTYSNHSPYNTCNHYGVDECNSWGDYFYMEALTRMTKEWNQYW